MAVLTTVD